MDVIVAALALLAATTGFCVGCLMYRLAAPLFGMHIRHLEPAAVCVECSTDETAKRKGC